MKLLSFPPARLSPAAVLAAAALALAGTVALAGVGTRPVRPKAPSPATAPRAGAGAVSVGAAGWDAAYPLKAGATVEISAHLEKPSALPDNGRLAVEWRLERPDNPADVVPTPEKGPRPVDAFGIYTAPTANWRKVLHALDPDVYVTYRAPVAGRYRLRLVPVTEETWVGDAPRWREKGQAPHMFPLPASTPWPAKAVAPVAIGVNPVDLGTEQQAQQLGTLIEAEPNDTPEQAQAITLVPKEGDIRSFQVTGTGDDVEYFDNGAIGKGGDDWFRVEVAGREPQLVTAQISVPGQFVVARVRTYQLDNGAPRVPLGALVPISEFSGNVNEQRLPYTEGKQVPVAEGMDPNERSHQQDEQHRMEISRILQPGKTYYFRVEANAPGYSLEFRVLKPAPWTDPRLAVRQSMYQHIGQVHAWLANRPRGASVDRRIRDTGNLLGTQCMSCHTQSGIWGPAVPVQNGYRVEQVLNFQQLGNIMYECLRPTNELKDAANNTSLATLDIGDGPAGTRAAGFNIVNAESIMPPRRLHSRQQIRTANFVLLTADPGGINAAGPGSNFGPNVVWLFAAEILRTAWDRTGEPRYFRALEEKAQRVLAQAPKVTDDLGMRMDFFGRVLPIKDYPAQAQKAADAERAAGLEPKVTAESTAEFAAKVRAQLAEDEARLRAIQNDDGTWSFSPGTTSDGGRTWKRGTDWDPAPTAVALTGLQALGFRKDDPAVEKGVQALLRIQDANGRWNRASITGFVTTAYVLRALGRLYPVTPRSPQRGDFIPPPNEGALAAVKRVQALALAREPRFTDLLVQAAKHPHPTVRYWAMIGLGLAPTDAAVPALMAALHEKGKPVRSTAAWALKQNLLDDRGWGPAFAALEKGDDYAREGVIQALAMRADAVMPKASLDWSRLTALLDRAMNEDPHPAVRAYASKAAWQWWIWNPPVRQAVNQAWIRMTERPEPNLLVEHNNRYSSQALFIANGHKANGSSAHQYRELAALFDAMRQRLEKAEPETKSLMARRLVAVGASFYETSGGDGGPGQMGYITPNSGAMFGQAVVVYMREVQPTGNKPAILAGLEGAANVPHGPLQEYLIDYALKAPEDLRKAAAAAVSDPRSAMLQAATELVEPLISQVKRGAAEPPRRASLSDPVLKLFGAVNWVIPADQEQQRHFFDLMIPNLQHYISPEAIAGMADPSQKAAAEREMDAAWYLADKLGEVLASNPDLHRDMVFQKYFPEKVENPLQRHFWVRSVPWLLEHRHAAPMVSETPAPGKQPAAPDPGLLIKDRALQLYLDALKPTALPETRAAAIRIANTTAVRKNAEVLLALKSVLEFEKNEKLRQIAENTVKQGSERFVPDLATALRAENKANNGLTSEGTVHPAVLADIVFFRDYVLPELGRVKRNDQQACQGCHGIPGRVPSYYFKPTDEFGYLSAADLLFTYRATQTKINFADLDKSKILRKPLNVQDGTEDGHQGGRRYLPQDEGYLILRRWVENQPKLQSTLGLALAPLTRPFRAIASLAGGRETEPGPRDPGGG